MCKADYASIKKAITDISFSMNCHLDLLRERIFNVLCILCVLEFSIPSQFTVARDCLGHFVDVLGELKTHFKVSC